MASSADDLVAIGLIEKDINGDVLWTWTYPGVGDDQRNVVLRKCGLQCGDSDRQISFVFIHFRRLWYYVAITEVFEADHLAKVKQFALVLIARDFNPEKYDTLCRILSKTYCKSGSPTAVVCLYLSVVTRGSCVTEENGTFFTRDFEQVKAYGNAGLKAIIKAFKLETILIYTALILKKRIIVYHHCLNSLLYFLRALPAFVWHRQNWDIVYPYVDVVSEEIDDLKNCVSYAAGFLDASIETRSDLYDIFINLAATEITVATHAKDYFTMSKLHKDIAVSMVQFAEDDDLTEHQTIKEIANKTKDILNQLHSLENKSQLSLSRLKEHKLAPALESFLFNLAVAENMNIK